ncbi:MAG: hypothetical protein KBB54_01125 [Candidatus Pacebacteria bacterium]|nr:hypothetical protein [Candidatus Paceibacterota bacterium]MBP9818377.1 hypothetical protein [Candidatus Paceibacterota bacterium]
MSTNIDLNRVGLLKLVAGKTVGEQLEGVKLAGPEVVEYIRSFDRPDGNFTAPAHWEPRESKSGALVCYSLIARGESPLFDRQDFLGFLWLPKRGALDDSWKLERHGRAVPKGDINVMDCMVVDVDPKVGRPLTDPKVYVWVSDDRVLIEL